MEAHFELLQESKGNDVLYVWTHLNLRGDKNQGIIHNMTYELGKLFNPI